MTDQLASSMSQTTPSIEYAKVEIRTGGRTLVYEIWGDAQTPLTGHVSVEADVREIIGEQPDTAWRRFAPTGRKTAQVSLSGVLEPSAA